MDFFKQTFTVEEVQEGLILSIDKPIGWTSFQVVNKIRWHLKNQTGLKKLKVGHAGTLDPLATGLLLLCTGKKTKSISQLQQKEKIYTGTITLGATTPSYDLETDIDNRFPTKQLTEDLLSETTKKFTGTIEQFPPLFSAVKKEGKRLYEYARAGDKPVIEARKVIVSKFELKRIELPELDFEIKCSKGTYIRSLAHDFGKKVQSGGYLSALKRTGNGDFSLEEAYTMESVVNENSKKNIKSIKPIS
jgi:tRNA pseudouridine55 synthase